MNTLKNALKILVYCGALVASWEEVIYLGAGIQGDAFYQGDRTVIGRHDDVHFFSAQDLAYYFSNRRTIEEIKIENLAVQEID